MTKPEFITIRETGEFNCICGNTPDDQGAYPCDSEGKLTEDAGNEWPGKLYRCDKCNRIFEGDTGKVVGVKQ
jgi:hypothetical protein